MLPAAAMPVISLSSAVRGLRARQQPRLENALSELSAMRFYARSAKILHELDRGALEDICKSGKTFVVGNWDRPVLVDAALTAINEVAQIDEDLIWDVAINGEEEITLIPATLNYSSNYDEWYDLIDNLSRETDDGTRLYVFMVAIRLGERNTLYKADDIFGWSLNEVDFRNFDKERNFKKWSRELKKLDWKCFDAAFDICAYNTGSVYFDWDPYDDNMDTYECEFSLQGIEELRKEWEKAQPFIEQWELAKEIFAQPGVPEELFHLWKKCAEREKRKRVKTLGEIFTQENEVENE